MNNWIGAWWVATCGMAQGCFASIIGINALMSVWLRYLQLKVPSIRAGALLDDAGVRAAFTDKLHFNQAMTISEEFNHYRGQISNIKNTQPGKPHTRHATPQPTPSWAPHPNKLPPCWELTSALPKPNVSTKSVTASSKLTTPSKLSLTFHITSTSNSEWLRLLWEA